MRGRVCQLMAWSVSVLLSATAALDCRQALDLQPRVACERPGVAPDACEACTQSTCCDAYLACLDSPGCPELESCTRGCGPEDEACRTACWLATPYGLGEAYAALLSCRLEGCGAACELSCGAYPYPDPKCGGCASACCDEEVACGQNVECLALAFCERGCALQDDECRGECQRSHRDGMDDARAFGSCITEKCTTECGSLASLTDWSCLDEEPKPIGSGPMVAVQLRFESFDADGYAEVPTYACPLDMTDSSCSEPVASGITDSNGELTLSVPFGFDGYFSFEGGGSPSSAELPMPTLLFGPPVTSTSLRGVSNVSYGEYQERFLGQVDAIDPSRGHLWLAAEDCANSLASMIAFELEPADAAATPFYGFLVPLSGPVTGGEGVGGFFNVSPGWVRATAWRHDVFPPECVASGQLLIRPGVETDMPIIPNVASCSER